MIYVHTKDDFCNYEFINKFLLLLLSGEKGEGGSGRVQLLPWEFLHFSVSCCAQPYTGALLSLACLVVSTVHVPEGLEQLPMIIIFKSSFIHN